jgi:hypothetical protein
MFDQACIVQGNVICFAFLSVWTVPISDIRRLDRRRVLNEARRPRLISSTRGFGVCSRFFSLFRPILIKFERMVSE